MPVIVIISRNISTRTVEQGLKGRHRTTTRHWHLLVAHSFRILVVYLERGLPILGTLRLPVNSYLMLFFPFFRIFLPFLERCGLLFAASSCTVCTWERNLMLSLLIIDNFKPVYDLFSFSCRLTTGPMPRTMGLLSLPGHSF